MCTYPPYPPSDSYSPDLVKVATAVEGATVSVYFAQEIGRWPSRIENDSDTITINAER
jgi:hypothetical protein